MNNKAPLVAQQGDRWLAALRAITHATNERTAIGSTLPEQGLGHSSYLLRTDAAAAGAALLVANFDSFVLDWTARFSVGGVNMNFFIVKQLPVAPPQLFLEQLAGGETYAEFMLPRVLELTYTAWDLQPFAEDLGYDGPPFRWDDERWFLLRCELDAAFFHLYQLQREDADYIMETFPIVKRRDEERFGEYRTKRLILEIYDEMAQAMRTGGAYRTRLDPPPADPRVAHPPRERVGREATL